MTTELKKFTEAYATMTVAAYEPLILKWVSLLGIRFVANAVVTRVPKARAVAYDGKLPAALALSKTTRTPVPRNVDFTAEPDQLAVPFSVSGAPVDPSTAKRIEVPGFPDAVAIGKDVYLHGFSVTDPNLLFSRDGGTNPAVLREFASRQAPFVQGLTAIPLSVGNRLGRQDPDFEFTATRDHLQSNLVEAASAWVADADGTTLHDRLIEASKLDGVLVPHLWPGAISIEEALSPIGIAHYFRQLYFNKEEGVGPIEQAFTVAPLETLEVVYETVRKQIHEEVLEQGLESVSETRRRGEEPRRGLRQGLVHGPAGHLGVDVGQRVRRDRGLAGRGVRVGQLRRQLPAQPGVLAPGG